MELKILLIGIPREWCGEILESSATVETRFFGSGLPHLEYEFYEHIATHNIIEITVKAQMMDSTSQMKRC